MCEVAARERDEPNAAVGSRVDAVGPPPLRRIPHLHLSAAGVEPTIDTALAGEPDAAPLVECRRIEVRRGPILGQGPSLDLARRRIDANDRVEATIGDPGGAVRADD